MTWLCPILIVRYIFDQYIEFYNNPLLRKQLNYFLIHYYIKILQYKYIYCILLTIGSTFRYVNKSFHLI